ncbi:hypothetical protein WAI453_001673 [Rhynchosporium graminicola]
MHRLTRLEILIKAEPGSVLHNSAKVNGMEIGCPHRSPGAATDEEASTILKTKEIQDVIKRDMGPHGVLGTVHMSIASGILPTFTNKFGETKVTPEMLRECSKHYLLACATVNKGETDEKDFDQMGSDSHDD